MPAQANIQPWAPAPCPHSHSLPSSLDHSFHLLPSGEIPPLGWPALSRHLCPLLLGTAKQLSLSGTSTLPTSLWRGCRKPNNGLRLKAMGEGDSCPRKDPEICLVHKMPVVGSGIFFYSLLDTGHQLGPLKDHSSACSCVTNISIKANTNENLSRHPGLNTFLLVSPSIPQCFQESLGVMLTIIYTQNQGRHRCNPFLKLYIYF